MSKRGLSAGMVGPINLLSALGKALNWPLHLQAVDFASRCLLGDEHLLLPRRGCGLNR
jgi:hypothetical protein